MARISWGLRQTKKRSLKPRFCRLFAFQDLIAHFQDPGRELLLPGVQDGLVNGIVHADHADAHKPDDNAGDHHVFTDGDAEIGARFHDVHGQAHAGAQDQGAHGAEETGEDVGGLFDLGIQGPEGLKLGVLFFHVLCPDLLGGKLLIAVIHKM